MLRRLLLGPVMIALVLGLAWLDAWIDALPAAWRHDAPGATWPPGVAVFTVALALSLAAAVELAALVRSKGIACSSALAALAAAVGMIATTVQVAGTAAIGAGASMMVPTAAAATVAVALTYYTRSRDPRGVIASASSTLLAFVYVGILPAFLVAIRAEHSIWLLVWVLLTTKSSDIGAYFTGKAIGRRKLIVWLSPGKTWEGLAGGVLASAAVGAGGAALLRSAGVESIPLGYAALFGGLFALIGQAGDLLESLLKRDAGVKDSGGSLPGFGGVLDVIDSLLLVAPVAYWLLRSSPP